MQLITTYTIPLLRLIRENKPPVVCLSILGGRLRMGILVLSGRRRSASCCFLLDYLSWGERNFCCPPVHQGGKGERGILFLVFFRRRERSCFHIRDCRRAVKDFSGGNGAAPCCMPVFLWWKLVFHHGCFIFLRKKNVILDFCSAKRN